MHPSHKFDLGALGLGLLTTTLGTLAIVPAAGAMPTTAVSQSIAQSTTGYWATVTSSDQPTEKADALLPSDPAEGVARNGVVTASESSAITQPESVTAAPTDHLSASDHLGILAQEVPPPPSPMPIATPVGSIRILSPQPSSTGDRTTSLVIQYPQDTPIQVTVNGKPLDPATPTQTEVDEQQAIVTQVWYKIPLQMGENTLAISGGEASASVQVTVKEMAARLELSAAGDARIPADGRSTITIQGQLTDEGGQVIPQDVVVTLTASAGKFVDADQDRDRPGFQVLARQGVFTAQLQSTLDAQKVRIRAAVDREQLHPETQDFRYPALPATPVDLQRQQATEGDGRRPTLLQPLTRRDEASAELTAVIETYTQVEFITNLRPAIVSGVVNLRIGSAGTDYFSSFRDFLAPDTFKDGTEFDLGGAIFATGKVGEWLFTGAYNSQRNLNQTCDGTTRLFRDTQFCDQTYPTYGDSSTTNYLTPSTDSVYLRLERTPNLPGAESDYAMWGDYTTQEFARASQLFTATTRQLHGFKGNYNLGNLQATLMYGNNIQGFQRDTVVPDGTSGYYFLSRRLVLGGSENVFLETEEINRPGTVIERKQLNRGPDYEIDYDRGSLLFRRPILPTEFDLFGRTLVRRIVITYQYENNGKEDTHLYAGRLQYNFSRVFGRESWAGFSYLREDEGAVDSELYGFDAFIPFGKDGKIIAEIARASNDSIFRGNLSGYAYRFEIDSAIGESTRARAYYRSVEEDFNNQATFSFTPGQTRYGAAIATSLSTTTKFQVQYDHETNFGIAPLVRTSLFDLFNPAPEAIPGSRVDNDLTTISAGIQQKLGAANLSIDWVNRSREDRAASNRLGDGESNQLVSRLSLPLAKKLIFRAQNELNLGGSDPLYPNRTTFGLDWAAFPGVTVRLAHQFFEGGQFKRTQSITSLDTLMDYRLTENTSLTGRYSVLGGLNNITGQGAVGLNHRWKIAPGLRMNLSYEHVFGNIFAYTAAGQQFAQPYAVGQSAASLGVNSGDSYSVGLEYTDNPNFQASARLEHRASSAGNNTVISAAATGKLSPALTALVRYQQAGASNQLLRGLGDTANLKLGLAYRNPSDDKLNALLRYEYRQNPARTPDSILFGAGNGGTDHTFALEAIYAPTFRWEFYGKYALRHSTSYLAQDLAGTNTISLAQLRATYRLGYNWDLVGEARLISQPATGYSETGWVVEAGYYLTPNLRLAAGYVFGKVSDRDFNNNRYKDGLYLGVTLKLNELFEGFGLQKPVPRQQQESQVQPVATTPVVPTAQLSATTAEAVPVSRPVAQPSRPVQHP